MADTKTSALTLSSTVDGDSDYVEFVDDSAADNKRALAKDITGGMIADGDAVKAFYRVWFDASATASYHKICTLPATSSSTGE